MEYPHAVTTTELRREYRKLLAINQPPRTHINIYMYIDTHITSHFIS